MATTQTLHDGGKTAVVKFHFDDGVGNDEAAVQKVDVSGLAAHPTKGTACEEVAIEQIWYQVSGTGLSAVDILWDATANVTAISVSGDGHKDYRSIGPISNNAGAGKTGDILFTTVGTVAAVDRYTITLVLRKIYA